MLFKFAHTSDWHFGVGRRLTPKSMGYLERHVDHLERFVEICRKEQVDFVLVSGDLFENSSTNIEELLAAYRIFWLLSQFTKVICTAGNHDELAVGEFQTEWMRVLGLENVHFVSEIQSIPIHMANTSVKVLASPWTGIKDQAQFTEHLTSNYNKEEIVMLHECFNGSMTDTGYQARGGIQVPNIEGVRYFACGDIHKYQRLNLEHAWFSGAPFQYNFGDRPGKGFIMVEAHSEYDYRPRFVQIPSPIEFHEISSLDQIPKDSPHWYKLRAEVNRLPRYTPENVKITEPLPVKIEIPIQMSKEPLTPGEVKPPSSIDYTEGVTELLTAAGYEMAEIQATKEEITRVATV